MREDLETKREGETRVYPSEELFYGSRQIIIKHGETEYRLSITKAGKLILNK